MSDLSSYAVIKTGGKQYRVAEGDVIKVERLPESMLQTVGEDQLVDFNEVLMLFKGDTVTVGAPLVEGAKVSAKVLDEGRAKKVNIIKFKRRKHHMKRQGHRQNFTQVKVTGIQD